MAAQVLVPIDGSGPARAVLEYAYEGFPDGRLTLLYVVDPMADYSRQRSAAPFFGESQYKNEPEKGRAVLDALEKEVSEGVGVETALEAGKPARTIVAYADDEGVDGIVIGSHGRDGPARYLLGSVTEGVVRRSAVPVTVVRGPRD